jgi:hypothetical protein
MQGPLIHKALATLSPHKSIVKQPVNNWVYTQSNNRFVWSQSCEDFVNMPPPLEAITVSRNLVIGAKGLSGGGTTLFTISGWKHVFQWCLGGGGNYDTASVLDSISSLFNVLIKSPISKTASFYAKPYVWPIDGRAQGLTNQRSPLGHIQAKTWDVFWLAAAY